MKKRRISIMKVMMIVMKIWKMMNSKKTFKKNLKTSLKLKKKL